MPNKKYGKSSKEYYDANPESYKKKLEAQKKINKKPSEIKKRAELVKLNRESQKSGKGKIGDNKDIAHTKNGTKLKDQSKNRGSKTDMPGDRRSRGSKKK